MNNNTRNATLLLILGNSLLFVLKIIVGLMSNSIAIISDAINSFTDIIVSIVVFVCVRMAAKRADKEHPFGHHRIEPVAGLVVAIFIALVGFEIIHVSFDRIISGKQVLFGYAAVAVLVFTMSLKTFMAIYLRITSRKFNSPALFSSSIDCRNDVFISGTVLLGFIGNKLGYAFLDPAVGIVVGLWIIFSGYQVGKSNIDFLVGKSPDRKTIMRIKKAALGVRGVKGVHDVRAHYVGSHVHVQVHIELDGKLSLVRAHDIEKKVQGRIMKSAPWINEAFVHIDPIRT